MNENEAGETRDCFWFYDEPCCICYDIPDEGYGDFNWIYYVKETCNVCVCVCVCVCVGGGGGGRV
jgi:hypothetical protein